ncbi:MAG: hypothetical protein CSB44_01955 [Gammaproteobacteria bacterium]|nr:MAG: hypothetical protein CSB44_01955 [Gammaproteobacteria bacterium]
MIASGSAFADALAGDAPWQQSFPLTILESPPNAGLKRPNSMRPLTHVDTAASASQIDPLSKTATVVFGPDVRSVGDAARMILAPVGYELLEEGPNVSALLPEFLAESLPDAQREFRHLQVREMLRALAGKGHVVVFDHVHRKATFDPIPRYRSIGQATQSDSPATNDLLLPIVPATPVPGDKMSDLALSEDAISNDMDNDGWVRAGNSNPLERRAREDGWTVAGNPMTVVSIAAPTARDTAERQASQNMRTGARDQ